MKKYLKLKENTTTMTKANFLRIELSYNLGGYNVFTHKSEARGYYLHVSPVERSTREDVTFESYTAFSGVKVCVLEVSRKSKKAEETAEKLATENESELVDYICNRYGLAVEA